MTPPKIRFAVTGLNHGHFYDQTQSMLNAGAEAICFYAPRMISRPNIVLPFPTSRGLRPQLGGGLTQVTGKLETLCGELVSKWALADDTFDWMVIVPPKTTVTVHLPVKEASDITLNGQAVSGSVHEVESGKHHFVVS
jgi:hypothetical protein